MKGEGEGGGSVQWTRNNLFIIYIYIPIKMNKTKENGERCGDSFWGMVKGGDHRVMRNIFTNKCTLIYLS